MKKAQWMGASVALVSASAAAMLLAACTAEKLKDIRLGLVYLPSPYKVGTLEFPVSIGGQ